MNNSLKVRLTLLLLVAIAGLGGFLMTEAYSNAHRAADRAFDSQLRAAALTIAQSIQWESGLPKIKIPVVALQILATRHQERVFYAILNADGTLITGNMPASIITSRWHQKAAQHPILRDTYIGDAPIRLYGYEFDTAGWQTQEPVQIWVGHTTAGRLALAGELFRRAIARFAVMVLLAAVLLMVAMRAILKPVHNLRQALRERDTDDTRPLHVGVPTELLEFTGTLNALFARQRESRENLIRFTADASHQIKTPLTGLRSACELALKSSQPREWHRALELVNENVIRTSRLAEQLLSLARLRHRGSRSGHVAINLGDLLRDCVMEWAERDIAKTHDLGLAELPDQALIITGDPLSLRELIGNLIDNALRYTPIESHITLGLKPKAHTATLYIEDNGSGVPKWLLRRLHRPFERADKQDATGSGLGMAIVDSIALEHSARLSFENCAPTGLRVCIHFPLASAH